MAEKKGERVVVLNSVISHPAGPFLQGQVINKDTLGDAHDRLAGLKAIRPASAEEAGLEKVDVSGVPLALSPLAQAELAAREATIERLTRQTADLQERLRAAPVAVETVDPEAFKELTKEKDAAIAALQKRVEGLEKEAAEMARAQAQQGGAAAGKAAPPPPKK